MEEDQKKAELWEGNTRCLQRKMELVILGTRREGVGEESLRVSPAHSSVAMGPSAYAVKP